METANFFILLDIIYYHVICEIEQNQFFAIGGNSYDFVSKIPSFYNQIFKKIKIVELWIPSKVFFNDVLLHGQWYPLTEFQVIFETQMKEVFAI